MPEDVQEQLYRSVVGLENVEIVRPAYGVEYDHVDARELKGMSETSHLVSLYQEYVY
jgi:tRNA uridine 5-carboxymethylaminomethyl modification enzyme